MGLLKDLLFVIYAPHFVVRCPMISKTTCSFLVRGGRRITEDENSNGEYRYVHPMQQESIVI